MAEPTQEEIKAQQARIAGADIAVRAAALTGGIESNQQLWDNAAKWANWIKTGNPVTF